MTDYIKKGDLVVGEVYECDARNFTKGTWDGHTFHYMRFKFNQWFPDTEDHWDDSPPHGTVKPLGIHKVTGRAEV